ncbi:MAG: ChaN family lipoprotein, partial [Hyphomicrobium sp.]
MRVLALAVSFVLMFTLNASACEYPRGPVFKLLEEWTKTCGHPLCGQIHIAEPGLLKEAAKTCDAKGWMSMREDIRSTVVAGGAVLFGEVHDNPLHHDLRSRLGMSNYGSSVFEQITVDKAAAIEAFLVKLGTAYKDTSLADLKTAVDWDKGGWAKYSYDPLLISVLKARQPLFAGDAPVELIKKIAAEGEGTVAADERARLKLDAALGDKADAASLDELVAGHCNTMA